MKYKKNKLDKKQVILECRKAHPDCSEEEIGEVFNVSKQYVSQCKLAREQEEARRLLRGS